METRIFLRYQMTPDHVHWCYGDGLLLAELSKIDYSPKIKYSYSNSSISEFEPEDFVSIEIHPLLKPKINYLDVLAQHPGTSKSLHDILKNKFWVPIMVFVTVDGEVGIFLHNYRTNHNLRIWNESPCDLSISFKYQKFNRFGFKKKVDPTAISLISTTTLPTYEVRFRENGSIPEMIDFEEAEAVISTYYEGHLLTDHLLIEDIYGTPTIGVHQYIDIL